MLPLALTLFCAYAYDKIITKDKEKKKCTLIRTSTFLKTITVEPCPKDDASG